MSRKAAVPFVLLIALAIPLLAACGSTAGGPQEVNVTLSDFKFESSMTNFKVGVPYHFVLKNVGQVPHEIMIMAPMEETPDMDMEEMDSMALAHVEADDLPAGATATMDYTFTQAAGTGELEFACHVPGHYAAGMKLPITVSE
jgi:uncharacterized cupredoxin-like copper-binding protein